MSQTYGEPIQPTKNGKYVRCGAPRCGAQLARRDRHTGGLQREDSGIWPAEYAWKLWFDPQWRQEDRGSKKVWCFTGYARGAKFLESKAMPVQFQNRAGTPGGSTKRAVSAARNMADPPPRKFPDVPCWVECFRCGAVQEITGKERPAKD